MPCAPALRSRDTCRRDSAQSGPAAEGSRCNLRRTVRAQSEAVFAVRSPPREPAGRNFCACAAATAQGTAPCSAHAGTDAPDRSRLASAAGPPRAGSTPAQRPAHPRLAPPIPAAGCPACATLAPGAHSSSDTAPLQSCESRRSASPATHPAAARRSPARDSHLQCAASGRPGESQHTRPDWSR